MHLTIQQLRIFEAVARNSSVTRAAEELFLTQPAISIQTKRLEENIGYPLFEHIGKRMFLTVAGEVLYQASRDILDRIIDLEGSLDERAGKVRGPLRLSVVTTAKYFMPHLLGAFLKLHPDVEPRLTVTNRAKVLTRLNDNSDDLVIMGQVPEELDVEAHQFLNNNLVVVAHPDHPLARRKREISLKQIVEERFLVREEGSGTRSAVDRLLAENGLRITPFMELGSGEAIKQGVMAGIGVSALSTLSVRLEQSTGLLTPLKVEGFPLVRPWHCVHHRHKHLSKTAQSFRDFLLEKGEALLKESAVGYHKGWR
ncbi:MAG: LysR family transcriptional regulator [Planctomycetes bacterium]|nr:LysR family transcriptional regulator [Planctomycetota bacterium]